MVSHSLLERRTGDIENLIDMITDYNNLEKAYKKSQKGKGKFKPEALSFSKDEAYNLLELQRELIDGTYIFSGYNEFTVTHPKERVINAPHYRDKIVQLAINNILKEVYQPCFIYDTYACLDDKGTHKCVSRIQYFMRKAYWEYGKDAYIVKIDIRKFFYTIDREVLKTLLKRKIKCQKTLELLFKIIDSADTIDVLGMPLGNTISQLCANIYMNMVDQYVKRGFSLKYYVRYADDVVIIVENKEKAKEVLNLVGQHAENKLNIKLNKDKSKTFPIIQGVNTVGFKIYPTHMLLRNDSKKRIKQKLRKLKNLLIEEKITIEKAEQMLNSWHGHAEQANSYTFVQSLLQRFDYIELVDKKSKGKIKKIFKVKKVVIENARKERTLSA